MEKLLKKLKEIEGITIVSFAEMNKEKFVNYEYFTIEKNNIFYYIQNNTLGFNGLTITAYKKIDFNHKHQLRYPKKFYTIEDILLYIKDTEKIIEKREPLKGTFKQDIIYDLYIIKNNQTMLDFIKNSGYRENEIIKNANKIEMIQNDGTYKVIKIYDIDNNYIEINLKNKDWNRLIVG